MCNIIYNIFYYILYITLIARKLPKPDDGRYRPKHVVFYCWAAHVTRTCEERGVHRILVGTPEGKRPMGRPRRRWVDNIRMDLQEV